MGAIIFEDSALHRTQNLNRIKKRFNWLQNSLIKEEAAILAKTRT